MRLITFILIFLSCGLYGQQIIELCEGNQTTFTYSSNAGIPGTYVWSIENVDYVSNDLVYNWTNIGEYDIKLVFTSAGGCKDSINYSVSVIECKETSIWFPNAFTPNQSGDNESWSPKGYNYKNLEYSIYNRWGELIFTSNSENNPWKGSNCQEDVYVYIATWKTIEGSPKRQYGHIVLLR